MLDPLLGHANCGCQFHKGSQLFIGTHNEALTVPAVVEAFPPKETRKLEKKRGFKIPYPGLQRGEENSEGPPIWTCDPPAVQSNLAKLGK